MPSLGRRIPVDVRERSRSDPHTGRECRSPSNSSIRIPEMQETRSRVHMHCLHTARCTVRGCTHAVEPVHTSLLHGFPLTANAWPQSALAYCKQPHWPGHMWGGLVWRRMERLQKNPQNSHLVRAAIKSFFSELMHHGQRCLIYHRSQNSYTCDIKIFKLLQ